VLATSTVLEPELLPIGRSEQRQQAEAPCSELLSLRELERRHIVLTLAHAGWNKRRACAILEISRPTLDRKIEEYAIAREIVS